MNFIKISIFTIVVFFSSNLFSQIGLQKIHFANQEIFEMPDVNFSKIKFSLSKFENLKINRKESKADFLNPYLPAPISKSNVYDCYGFICKLEVEIDKKTKMSTRFRLGNLDYVNSLEGK